MERNYKGYEIAEPGKFQRLPGAKGAGTTSVQVRVSRIDSEKPTVLKTFNYKRYNTAERAKAIEKAEGYIDDLLAEGKPVKIKSGVLADRTGVIECVSRNKVKGKIIITYTVAMDGEDTPPFEAFKADQIEFL